MVTFLTILNEISTDMLKQQFVDTKKISLEDFQNAIKASNNKSAYVTWIVKRVVDKDLDSEDIYKFEDIFKIFNRRKRDFPFQDINQYKRKADIQTLMNTAFDIKNSEEIDKTSATGVSKEEKFTEYKIGDVDGFTVYKLGKNRKDLYPVSVELGTGTNWCTATGNTNTHYNNYISKNPLYIFINSSTKEKFQFWLEPSNSESPNPGQFKDKKDQDVVGDYKTLGVKFPGVNFYNLFNFLHKKENFEIPYYENLIMKLKFSPQTLTPKDFINVRTLFNDPNAKIFTSQLPNGLPDNVKQYFASHSENYTDQTENYYIQTKNRDLRDKNSSIKVRFINKKNQNEGYYFNPEHNYFYNIDSKKEHPIPFSKYPDKNKNPLFYEVYNYAIKNIPNFTKRYDFARENLGVKAVYAPEDITVTDINSAIKDLYQYEDKSEKTIDKISKSVVIVDHIPSNLPNSVKKHLRIKNSNLIGENQGYKIYYICADLVTQAKDIYQFYDKNDKLTFIYNINKKLFATANGYTSAINAKYKNVNLYELIVYAKSVGAHISLSKKEIITLKYNYSPSKLTPKDFGPNDKILIKGQLSSEVPDDVRKYFMVKGDKQKDFTSKKHVELTLLPVRNITRGGIGVESTYEKLKSYLTQHSLNNLEQLTTKSGITWGKMIIYDGDCGTHFAVMGKRGNEIFMYSRAGCGQGSYSRVYGAKKTWSASDVIPKKEK